eukprot:TRINITY_DN26_c0_g1_i1.p1 TRINITY_DN26_c0_g1~~TRINITY_DN26_c0_g1_i1.p1  ORF type:complete len:753 (-),score=61.33 TRINITY_DN26_c0_g1_i1:198-2408(-)
MTGFAVCRVLVVLAPVIAIDVRTCLRGVNMARGNLNGEALDAASPEDCSAACEANPHCALFSFHRPNCSYDGEICHQPSGCCWMKRHEENGYAPTVNMCSCSGYVRLPETHYKPPHQPPPHAKNILYILLDDMRPELESYGQSSQTHHSPHIKSLADRGTVFDNAYAQIAVCSPSRLSFLTGRRPDNAGIYNFINHFRQADCGLNHGGVFYTGVTFKTTHIAGCSWGGKVKCGGSGQCCSLCSDNPKCNAWTYMHDSSMCYLKTERGKAVADDRAVSGVWGTFETHAKWTTIPQHFRKHGWLSLSSGKIWHPEEGGVGNLNPDLNGPGMPPNADPPSWSDGLFMARVNDVAKMDSCKFGENSDCPVDADIHGNVRDPANTQQLCDRIIADDTILKLRLAAQNLRRTGQPFFMAAGFRKPHLDFRFPRPILDLLPAEKHTDVATHPTLHPSQPPIAHWDGRPQKDPFHPLDNATARQYRLFYRAAVAWVDSQIGRVLDVLKALDLEDTTMVVLHSDHGYSLGEHGQWQKFTNFEHGTRVPLIIRVPWIPASTRGARTKVLAELTDIFPTMTDALGVPVVGPEELDGTSLLPVLKNPGSYAIAMATKEIALSQYHRCPENVQDPALFFKHNDCDMVDRSQIPFFGYSIRTPRWRYTEWVRWKGATLEPDWSSHVASELYSHDGDDGFDFNAFENVNQIEQHPTQVETLSKILRRVVDNQRKLWRGSTAMANATAEIVI